MELSDSLITLMTSPASSETKRKASVYSANPKGLLNVEVKSVFWLLLLDPPSPAKWVRVPAEMAPPLRSSLKILCESFEAM